MFAYMFVCVRCYFANAKIAYVHACTQSLYVIVVYLLTLQNIKNSFCQFVNDLYSVLKKGEVG